MRINRFEEKIIGFRDIDDNLLVFLDFYFMDIFNCIIYLLAFVVLFITRNDLLIDLCFIKEEL